MRHQPVGTHTVPFLDGIFTGVFYEHEESPSYARPVRRQKTNPLQQNTPDSVYMSLYIYIYIHMTALYIYIYELIYIYILLMFMSDRIIAMNPELLALNPEP